MRKCPGEAHPPPRGHPGAARRAPMQAGVRSNASAPRENLHPMSLGLDDELERIDARVANRRMGTGARRGPPAHVAVAEGLQIRTVRGLLHHYPRRYIDRSEVGRIRDLRVGQYATVIATVRSVNSRYTRHRKSMVTVRLYD